MWCRGDTPDLCASVKLGDNALVVKPAIKGATGGIGFLSALVALFLGFVI